MDFYSCWAGIAIGMFIMGFGVFLVALFWIAKQTDIDNGIEPSLEQEDRFVVIENVEEIEE